MQQIKVTNLTNSLLILNKGTPQISLSPEKSKTFSTEEYVEVAKACNSFHSSDMVKIVYIEKENGKKTVSSEAPEKDSSIPANNVEAVDKIKAELASLKKEFKNASSARKEVIALKVEELKEDAKRLK